MPVQGAPFIRVLTTEVLNEDSVSVYVYSLVPYNQLLEISVRVIAS